MARHLTFVREPRMMPAVLSPEEAARTEVGGTLRSGSAVALKVSDIDSERLLLRIEQGKGHKEFVGALFSC
jgi:integrase/recombinase XerD